MDEEDQRILLFKINSWISEVSDYLGLVDHGKDFEMYAKNNRKSLNNSKQDLCF